MNQQSNWERSTEQLGTIQIKKIRDEQNFSNKRLMKLEIEISVIKLEIKIQLEVNKGLKNND